MTARHRVLRLLEYAAWTLVVVVLWALLRKWFAPDGCLDRGGSFDYVKWECDLSNDHPYIAVPVYAHAESWMFTVCALLAIGLSIAHRVGRKLDSFPQRPYEARDR